LGLLCLGPAGCFGSAHPFAVCSNPASSSMIDGKLRRRKVMLLGATVKNSQSPNQFTTSIQEET
ncbi:hypothetical protein CSKR_201763, partial [Clonorchis sinensis]